jgi:hypothetical protein
MHLMRDAMKRLTRLTPFLMLDVIGPTDVDAAVEALMLEASAAIVKSRIVPDRGPLV